jgi:hypothetical protein
MINSWNLPKLHVQIAKMEGGPVRYRWSVTLMAPDFMGTRSLGYRRAGLLENNLDSIIYDENTAVHDHERDVWTPMNANDRPDIQVRIAKLVRHAAKQMHASGEHAFEHTVPDS